MRLKKREKGEKEKEKWSKEQWRKGEKRKERKKKADFIVAECHAGRRLAPWLLHLTDWELLRTSPVPVLLVKSGRCQATRVHLVGWAAISRAIHACCSAIGCL